MPGDGPITIAGPMVPPLPDQWWNDPQYLPMPNLFAPPRDAVLEEIRDHLRVIRELLEKQTNTGLAREFDRLTEQFRVTNGIGR